MFNFLLNELEIQIILQIKFEFMYFYIILQSVLKSKAFQELSDESLIEVLQSDKLKMDEVDLLKYVKDWATINSVSHSHRKYYILVLFILCNQEYKKNTSISLVVYFTDKPVNLNIFSSGSLVEQELHILPEHLSSFCSLVGFVLLNI